MSIYICKEFVTIRLTSTTGGLFQTKVLEKIGNTQNEIGVENFKLIFFNGLDYTSICKTNQS